MQRCCAFVQKTIRLSVFTVADMSCFPTTDGGRLADCTSVHFREGVQRDPWHSMRFTCETFEPKNWNVANAQRIGLSPLRCGAYLRMFVSWARSYHQVHFTLRKRGNKGAPYDLMTALCDDDLSCEDAYCKLTTVVGSFLREIHIFGEDVQHVCMEKGSPYEVWFNLYVFRLTLPPAISAQCPVDELQAAIESDCADVESLSCGSFSDMVSCNSRHLELHSPVNQVSSVAGVQSINPASVQWSDGECFDPCRVAGCQFLLTSSFLQHFPVVPIKHVEYFSQRKCADALDPKLLEAQKSYFCDRQVQFVFHSNACGLDKMQLKEGQSVTSFALRVDLAPLRSALPSGIMDSRCY